MRVFPKVGFHSGPDVFGSWQTLFASWGVTPFCYSYSCSCGLSLASASCSGCPWLAGPKSGLRRTPLINIRLFFHDPPATRETVILKISNLGFTLRTTISVAEVSFARFADRPAAGREIRPLSGRAFLLARSPGRKPLGRTVPAGPGKGQSTTEQRHPERPEQASDA